MRKARFPMKTVTFSIDKKIYGEIERFCEGVRIPKSLILNAAINRFLNLADEEKEKAIKNYITRPK